MHLFQKIKGWIRTTLMSDLHYCRELTKEDYCTKYGGVVIQGLWNSKLGKVVSWCPKCDLSIGIFTEE